MTGMVILESSFTAKESIKKTGHLQIQPQKHCDMLEYFQKLRTQRKILRLTARTSSLDFQLLQRELETTDLVFRTFNRNPTSISVF